MESRLRGVTTEPKPIMEDFMIAPPVRFFFFYTKSDRIKNAESLSDFARYNGCSLSMQPTYLKYSIVFVLDAHLLYA